MTEEFSETQKWQLNSKQRQKDGIPQLYLVSSDYKGTNTSTKI